jgi:hypothetical protein
MISIYLHILIVFTFYWDTTHITNTFSINFIFWIPNTKMSFWFKFKWWSQRKKLKKLKSQSLFEPHGTVKHVWNSANQDFDKRKGDSKQCKSTVPGPFTITLFCLRSLCPCFELFFFSRNDKAQKKKYVCLRSPDLP